MLTIEVLQGKSAGRKLPLEAPVTIGSAPENRLALDDDGIAPEHGQIFREGTSYSYQDLAGAAPSTIHRGSDTFVAAGTHPVALKDRDILHLGPAAHRVILLIHIEGTAQVAFVDARVDFSEFEGVAARLARDTGTAPRLLEVTQKLARRSLDRAAVFEGVADAVFELIPHATHVAIALADANFETVYRRARAGAGGGDVIKVPRAVIARVQEGRDAFVAADAQTDAQLSSSETATAMRMAATIGAPLWDGEIIRGVIHIYNRGSDYKKFDRGDLSLMVTLAGQASLAIENASLYARLKSANEKLKAAEEQARGENRYLKNREERRRAVEMIGESSSMQAILIQIDKVKDTRATVCIEGETGTGKELIASAIHYQGSRRDKLFVAQNCAAVPENLLESELFGHKKGSFTGADHDKKGLFEIADGGTLFLDEIGEMTLGLQAKLLRVLQEGEIRPVGATTPRAVDVRIITATNRNLEKEVERAAFRQDLFYRLKQYPMRLPPLRERREDIPGLVEHFLRKYVEEMKKPIAGITPEAMDQLTAYNWPGNIRELENEVLRFVIQADADAFITPELLAPQIRKVEELLGRVGPKKGTLKDRVEEVERWLLAEALREHGGNKTRTAETLGMTREGLHKKLSKYGM